MAPAAVRDGARGQLRPDPGEGVKAAETRSLPVSLAASDEGLSCTEHSTWAMLRACAALLSLLSYLLVCAVIFTTIESGKNARVLLT